MDINSRLILETEISEKGEHRRTMVNYSEMKSRDDMHKLLFYCLLICSFEEYTN